jgi:integrase
MLYLKAQPIANKNMSRATEHKEGRASVRVVYRMDKTLKDGSHPFWIRITKNRKSKYVATNQSLHPKYWNEDKKTIRRSYPENLRNELEGKLAALEAMYKTAAGALVEADEQHDAGAVAAKAVEDRRQTRKTSLLAYIDTLVDNMVKTRKTGNSIVYRDLRNQLAKFIEDEYGVEDVPFSKVTVGFCHEWETTLRATGATDNTLSNRFRTLRAVLNRAIANGYAKPETYPFARNVAEKHKFSVGKFDTTTQKRAVSREAIRAVENYVPAGSATGSYADLKNRAEVYRLQRAKDIFLFSFYVAGINFVDLAKLRWQDISTDAEGNHRISYVRQKTGGKFSLRLIAPAVAIVERYRRETYTGPTAYVFPILREAEHVTDTQKDNRIHKILGQTNTDLKTIGTAIGLATPLTTYVARHSFATNLKRAGHANAVIGQALGHRDEATTTIYLDSFGSDAVDAAFDSLL